MSSLFPLVLATGNANKVSEILEIFSGSLDRPLAAFALEHDAATYGYLVAPTADIGDAVGAIRPFRVAPDVEETGATLLANARIKATALRDATGLTAIADDTGLVVDQLGGAPGVHSARYAGEAASYQANVDRLLRELAGVAPADRTARFTTVALVAFADGSELHASGTIEGTILQQPAGTEGFGYDPVFAPEGDDRSFAQMSPSEKHACSHRGRAFRALAATLMHVDHKE